MIVEDLIDKLVEECDPDDTVLVDCSGCIYEVLSIRIIDGSVVIDAF